MAKVMQAMQYDVEDEKRGEYLAAVEELKVHFGSHPHISYSVYEQKGKKNAFVEMFLAETEEAFKEYEESEDEAADELAARIAACVKDGKARYTTYLEVK